ncbi:bactofilin family protein [Nitrospira sp. M1]
MAIELDERDTMNGQSTGTTTNGGSSGYRNGSTPAGVKGDVVAFIGPGVEFKGVISYQGSVQIDGKLDGELHTEGTLLVGEQAVITAKISAGSVISRGEIKGDIVAKEKVQLLATAVMEGSLNTPQLSMENGVVLNGTIEMKTNGAKKAY